MLFSSITFLYVFLPVTLALYFLAPKGARNFVLLAASLLFYFWGERAYTLLLVISSVSDYLHGLFIEAHRGRKSAKAALISAIVINLTMLGVFKYLDFILATVNGLFGTAIPLPGLELPIGISFFTFQTMSYSIDVYSGKAHVQRNFISFATYVCLFPQLVAGPIVRYAEIGQELENRTITAEGFAQGARRFAVGLGKKVLLANLLGELVSLYQGQPEKTVLFAWMSAIAYVLQLYYDFSGYSDMAIGLGKILGFTFPENFNYPLISGSISEYWKRWHMTMGGWFRDYVYVPLGGSRTTTIGWLRNVIIVWFLTGLWHGAAWNYVAWGLLYGVLLLLEKRFYQTFLERHRIFAHGYVLLATILLYAVFGGGSMAEIMGNFSNMFGGGALVNADTVYYLRSYFVVLVIGAVGATPLVRDLARRVDATKAAAVLQPAVTAGLLVLSTAYLIDGSFNPFLYFRF